MDIAVLQLETDEKFIPVAFGDSDKARIGDWVLAIGNPFGLGGTVTAGIISARNRSIGLSRYEDASVAENSPSEKAGIQAGDIILEFNGEKINQMKELPAIVARTEVGKKVEVKVWRDKKEIIKNVILGRLETSDDFKISKNQETQKQNNEEIIESLRIAVRPLTKEDIKNRNLPNQTTGLVITKIANNSPVANSIELNSIIIEAQKKKIRSADDLRDITKEVLNSNQKTVLLAIYNNQNQRRYIGVKLD